MTREKIDELLRSEFNDCSKIKEDSIKNISAVINFTRGKGTSTYHFATENANYELTLRHDVVVDQGTSFDDLQHAGENKWTHSNYKIQSLKLRD